MNYMITARCWNKEFQTRFGDRDTYHYLTNADVVDLIILLGRAEITEENGRRTLDFHNDYD